MNIAIVVFSLVFLITLHELGHFLLAKKFDVKVHEFGIGFPPRAFAKKIGETLYSINILPLGGFVRMMGEDEKVEDERSFSEKPIWQRAIILIAGVSTSWILAMLVFAIVASGWGVMRFEFGEDRFNQAFLAGRLTEEDNIVNQMILENDFKFEGEEVDADKLKSLALRDQELVFERDEERIVIESIDGFNLRSIGFGITHPLRVTALQATGLRIALEGFVTGEGLPEDMEFGGPVMIGDMATEALDRGVGDYLMFVGMIATILAFMNILPIPALDGGRLMFLGIEKVKGEPIPVRVERAVNTVFFLLIVILMIVVTVRDIYNIF